MQTKNCPKCLILGLNHALISLSDRPKPTICALRKINSPKLNISQYTTFSISRSFAFELYSLLENNILRIQQCIGSYFLRNRDKGKSLVLANIKIFKVLMLPLFNCKSLKYKYKQVFSSLFMRSLQKSIFQPPKYSPYQS